MPGRSAQFDRKLADLAVLRTDAKIPPRARSIAILEHDVLLLISPGDKKIKSLAELKKKKVALLTSGNNSLSCAMFSTSPRERTPVRACNWPRQIRHSTSCLPLAAMVPLSPSTMRPRSSRTRTSSRPPSVRRSPLNAIDEAKALSRRHPGILEETLATGLLSSTPQIPDDDLDTVGLQWLLVGQATMSTNTAGELARTIYENKAELSLDNGFASKIEPADVEKTALVVAHQGVTEYINDTAKSFLERYSDLFYLGLAALSVIGSLFLALYTKVTRVAPEKASELATAILDIGEKTVDARYDGSARRPSGRT